MKNWVPFGLIIAIAVVGFFWLREHDAAVKLRALAEERLVVLQKVTDSLHVRDSALVALEAIRIDQRKKLLGQNRQLQAAGVATQEQVSVAVDALKESLSVEQARQLDSITTGYQKIIALRDQQIGNLVVLLANDSVMVAEQKNLLSDYRSANNDLLDQVVLLTKHLKPSKFETATKLVTLVLVGVAAVK